MLRVLILCGIACCSVARAAEVTLEVRAGGHQRKNCPVSLPVPDALREANTLSLRRVDTGEFVPVQKAGTAKARRLFFMLDDPLPSGSRRRYVLADTSARPRQRPAVKLQDANGQLEFSVDGARVLRFNQQTVRAPEGIDPAYERSGYIHPLYTPQGQIVTGDFEADHPHQHGVFFAWVNATFEEQPVDFWNQIKASGGVTLQEVTQRRKRGAVFAQLSAKLSHYANRDDKRQPVLEETWQVRVYNSKPFLVEIVSRQRCVADSPLTVEKYHYGGFALRGPSAWLTASPAKTSPGDDPVAAAGFLTSEGRRREDGNHTRARWVTMHGPLGSQHGSVTALASPQNFRAPQPVRLHPNKPYFCFAPMVTGAFQVEPDEVYLSRYRLVIHDGGPDAELSERMWQDWAHPPKVVLLNP